MAAIIIIDSRLAAEAVADEISPAPENMASKSKTDVLHSTKEEDVTSVHDESTTTATDLESQDSLRSKFRIFAIMSAVYLSLFVAALDGTIISTAAPTISADLKSATGYTWISGAYLIANAAASPIWAKLSDIWGRKPMLLACVFVFTVSSILCAVSIDMTMLIASRALQGTAAGGIILLVHVVISDLFSMRRRSLYLGWCEGIWAVAGAAGPVLGGVLTSLATWRWCFWINLPCCTLAFVLLLLFLDVHNPRTKFMDGMRAIDWAGTISILAVTLMLLLGLHFGGDTFPWSSPKVICLIVIGAACLVLFYYSEKKLAEYPLMPLWLFNDRSNVAALLVVFFHAMAYGACDFFLPLYLQSVLGATPLRSGVLLVPLMLVTALSGIVTGLVIHRTGRYQELLWGGTFFMALGVGLLILLDVNSAIVPIVAYQILVAVGAGALFEPPLIALQCGVAQDDVATATSTLSFIRSLAFSFTVILGGVVFSNSMDKRKTGLNDAGLPAEIVENLSGGRAAAHVSVWHDLSDPAQQLAVREAFAWSTRNLWIFCTVIAICAFVSGIFVAKRQLSYEHTETITGLKKKHAVTDIELRVATTSEGAVESVTH